MSELFSVIVLCYRKFEFVYGAVRSVLEQDYDNIELIVSDDGSEGFPECDIRQFIENNKKSNIVRVVINHEKENRGTVRHLNRAIALATGEYIVALAADDQFYNKVVLKNYRDGFHNLSENCLIEMAHTAMYDYELKENQGYYLRPEIAELLNRKECLSELFSTIAYKAYLPSTSTCFRKEFFEKFGKFDERFYLVEDVPMHLRLARERWLIGYVNFVAIKHRTGGISHGSIGGLSRSNYLYFRDLINIKKYEVVPYYNLIERQYLNDVKQVIKSEKLRLIPSILDYEGKWGRIFLFKIAHIGFFLKSKIFELETKFGYKKQNIIQMGIYGLIISNFVPVMGPIILKNYGWLSTGVGNILNLFSSTSICLGIAMWLNGIVSRKLMEWERFPEEFWNANIK